MKKQGTVVKWDDARGFGFIRSGAKGDLFFHVRDFRGMNTLQPREGLLVSFEETTGSKGPRAVAVQPASEVTAGAIRTDHGRQRAPAPDSSRSKREDAAPSSGAAFALPMMVAYGAAVGWVAWTRQLPWWVLPALAGINLITFIVYWHDKSAANDGTWRISERTLHFWSLAGGWPAAWFAQQVLRHKSRKQSFRLMYWVTVVLHCAAVVWFYLRALTPRH